MAKKKKATTTNTDKNIKITDAPKAITDKQRKEAVDNLKNIKEGHTVTVPADAIVNVPISGAFRKAIEGVLYYVMEPLTPNQIIVAMGKIKKNFEGLEREEVHDHERAIWCLMTLLSEIHWQAAEQKQTVETDQTIDETFSNLIAGLEGSTAEVLNKVEELKAKKKKSNEDSNQ